MSSPRGCMAHVRLLQRRQLHQRTLSIAARPQRHKKKAACSETDSKRLSAVYVSTVLEQVIRWPHGFLKTREYVSAGYHLPVDCCHGGDGIFSPLLRQVPSAKEQGYQTQVSQDRHVAKTFRVLCAADDTNAHNPMTTPLPRLRSQCRDHAKPLKPSRLQS